MVGSPKDTKVDMNKLLLCQESPKQLNVYKVDRLGYTYYCMDYSMIVVACDEMWAEKIARIKSEDFRKSKLKVTKVDLAEEGVLLVANMGA